MVFYRRINGHNIWVTVEMPLVKDEQGKGYTNSSEYCSFFRFENAPWGECVREEGEVVWFSTPEEAADAAFIKAEERITI